MRIAVVTHYWAPHVGGIERVALRQALALASAGHDVTVFTSRLKGDPATSTHDGVTIRRFRCLNVLEHWASVPVPLMAPTMLAALWRFAHRDAVLIAHGHVYIGSIFSAIARRRCGSAFVVVQHNPFVDYGSVLNRIEALVDRVIGRRVLEAARFVACVSEHTADYVRSITPRASIVVGVNGVDTATFHPLDGPPRNRPERPYVLTVRRLVPRNGVDLLLEAWRSGELRHHAELRIVGVGPEEARLRALAEGDASVRFLGAVDEGTLAELHRGAAVFVLPTRSGEGYGLAAAEALASGVPVVSTSEGWRSEVIDHDRNGIILGRDDAEALAEALRTLLVDSGTRERLAQGARASSDRLSWSLALETFVRRVESLAA